MVDCLYGSWGKILALNVFEMETFRRHEYRNYRCPVLLIFLLAYCLIADALLPHSQYIIQLSDKYSNVNKYNNSYRKISPDSSIASIRSRRSNRMQLHSTGLPQMSTPMTSSPMSHADLAVRLDQPILSKKKSCNFMIKSLFSVLVSDVFKTACLAFLIAFCVTFISKYSEMISRLLKPFFSSIVDQLKLIRGVVSRVADTFEKETDDIPMVFAGEDGWDVCTFVGKQSLGRSQFELYEFKLPKPENTLPLTLGQKITLCCLDDENNVAKRNFSVFSPKSAKGSFSIIASRNFVDVATEKAKVKNSGEGSFTEVLTREMEIGDEIALQPGPKTLYYKGEYLPVTDMVYIATADGIVPVINQVKSVLSSKASSVKEVTVVWTNKKEEDFDIAISTLEDEYFKFSTKLAVSCIVEDRETSLEDNSEANEAIPSFNPGTMAIVSGSKSFSDAATAILVRKRFPESCICVLPND